MFKHCVSPQLLEVRELYLMEALTYCAGTYYDFNVTQDKIIGTPIQIIDETPYDILEMTDLTSNYTEFINYFGPNLSENEQLIFFDLFSTKNLIKNYKNGNTKFSHTYWTFDVLGKPLYAQHTVFLYEDPESKDILAFAYIKNLTTFAEANEAHMHAIADKEELESLNRLLTDAKLATEQAYLAAERANNAKTVFLNNMSHDIRTPMNAILGFTSLAIKNINNTEAVKKYLSKIMTSSEHLLSLINDVLDMSRIESGRIVVEEKEHSISEILHDIKNIMQSDVASKHINFKIDTSDINNRTILCDKLRLSQILINCISNSVKFTPDGGTVEVKIIQHSSLPGYCNYEFRIKDTGIGISEDYMEHIFEPFSRENNETINKIPGTGLGMPIAKNLVEMLGGTFNIESSLNIGTEFIIHIPFKIVLESNHVQPIENMQNMRVLIADSDMKTCSDINTMLKEAGLNPEWTTSGKEALYRARYADSEQSDPFGLYIIDWSLTDIDSIELIHNLRSEFGNSIPIIILTSVDVSEIEKDAYEAGVSIFCEKPLSYSELYDAIKRISERNIPSSENVFTQNVFANKNVLLADDVELNREFAATVLQEAGINVVEAENGKEVIDLITDPASHFDLILMDIMMPVMNGYEATKKIRKLPDEKLSTIPIIAMTANAFEEDRTAALEAGMNAHLPKPINIELLYELMKMYLL